MRNGSLRHVLTLPLYGEHDIYTAPQLEEQLSSVFAGVRYVVLDFSNVAYIDSSVLSLLVRQKKRVGDRLQIVVPAASQVNRILDLSGLREALGIHSTVAEALARVNDRGAVAE